VLQDLDIWNLPAIKSLFQGSEKSLNLSVHPRTSDSPVGWASLREAQNLFERKTTA
jgi:hypothetical protein